MSFRKNDCQQLSFVDSFWGLTERENEEFANLFLSYLIIKNKFMAELVQSNSRFGFANFAMYQERKGRYLCNT